MAKKNVLRILDRTGDTAVEWAPGVKTEEKAAEAKFGEMQQLGYLMFAVPATKDEKPTQIRKFDPQEREIIAVPQYKGG